jgi:hypothetical protein
MFIYCNLGQLQRLHILHPILHSRQTAKIALIMISMDPTNPKLVGRHQCTPSYFHLALRATTYYLVDTIRPATFTSHCVPLHIITLPRYAQLLSPRTACHYILSRCYDTPSYFHLALRATTYYHLATTPPATFTSHCVPLHIITVPRYPQLHSRNPYLRQNPLFPLLANALLTYEVCLHEVPSGESLTYYVNQSLVVVRVTGDGGG